MSYGSMSIGITVRPRSAIFCGRARFAPRSSVLYGRPRMTMAGLPLASTSLRMRAPSSRLRRSNSACAACALRQALRICARVTPRRPAEALLQLGDLHPRPEREIHHRRQQPRGVHPVHRQRRALDAREGLHVRAEVAVRGPGVALGADRVRHEDEVHVLALRQRRGLALRDLDGEAEVRRGKLVAEADGLRVGPARERDLEAELAEELAPERVEAVRGQAARDADRARCGRGLRSATRLRFHAKSRPTRFWNGANSRWTRTRSSLGSRPHM